MGISVNGSISNNDLFPPEMLKELEKRTTAITKELSGRECSMSKVAFNLAWVSRNKMYRAYGYDGIADYARDRFDISRSSCYTFIQTAERFGRYDDRDSDKLLDGLKDCWKVYSFSKLSVMVQLSDLQILSAGIKSDLSVREIKKIVKNILGGLEGKQSSSDEDPDVDDYTKDYNLPFYSAGHFGSEGKATFDRIKNTLKQHPEVRLEMHYRYVDRNVTI